MGGNSLVLRAMLALSLAGCAATLTASDRALLRVNGQDVTIAAPPGLCVDPQSLDVTRAGAFLLISDCTLFGGPAGEAPPLNGVLRASVSTGGLPGTLAELESFLTGPGAITLGKSGQPDKVRVIGSRREDGVLYLRIEDTGPDPTPGASTRFSRAFFEINGRLVGASLVGFASADIARAAADRVLRRFAAVTRAANPGTPANS